MDNRDRNIDDILESVRRLREQRARDAGGEAGPAAGTGAPNGVPDEARAHSVEAAAERGDPIFDPAASAPADNIPAREDEKPTSRGGAESAPPESALEAGTHAAAERLFGANPVPYNERSKSFIDSFYRRRAARESAEAPPAAPLSPERGDRPADAAPDGGHKPAPAVSERDKAADTAALERAQTSERAAAPEPSAPSPGGEALSPPIPAEKTAAFAPAPPAVPTAPFAPAPPADLPGRARAAAPAGPRPQAPAPRPETPERPASARPVKIGDTAEFVGWTGERVEAEESAAPPSAHSPSRGGSRQGGDTGVYDPAAFRREPLPEDDRFSTRVIGGGAAPADEMQELSFFDIERDRYIDELSQAVGARLGDGDGESGPAPAPSESAAPEDDRSIYDTGEFTPPDQIREFQSSEDAADIRRDIDSTFSSLCLRAVLCFFPAAVLTAMAVLSALSVPLPPILSFKDDPFAALSISVALLAASMAVSLNTLIAGFTGLLKGSNDSLAAVTSVAVLAHSAAMFGGTERLASGAVSVYCAAAALGLFVGTVGKWMMFRRIRANFKFIAGADDKYSCTVLEDPEAVSQIERKYLLEGAVVGVQVEAKFLNRYLHHAYSEDPGSRAMKVITPVIVGLSAAVGGAAQFLFSDAVVAVSSAVAALAFSSPISAMIVSNWPLYFTGRRLKRWGAVVSGYSAAEMIEKVDVIAVSDRDLLPAGSIELARLRQFGEFRIDEAILCAASLVTAIPSSLTDLFMKIIDGKTSMLRPVENASYYDKGGIEAWIDKKRMYLGSREQMQNLDFAVPSRDYESKYLTAPENRILYLAVAGHVSAMFVLSIAPRGDIALAAKRLIRAGFTVLVDNKNPLVDTASLTEILKLPEVGLHVMPASLAQQVERGVVRQQVADSALAHKGSFESFAYALLRAIKMRWSVLTGTWIQNYSSVFGAVLAGVIIGVFGLPQLSAGVVVLYQLAWLLFIMAAQRIRG